VGAAGRPSVRLISDLALIVVAFLLVPLASQPAYACATGDYVCNSGTPPSTPPPNITVTNAGINTPEGLTELTQANATGQIPAVTKGGVAGPAARIIAQSSSVSYLPGFQGFDPSKTAPPTGCAVEYDAPVSVDPTPTLTPGTRLLRWVRPQDAFPKYPNSKSWAGGQQVANSPTAIFVTGDQGAAQVPETPNDGSPTGDGLQDMENGVVLAGQNELWIAYAGQCTYKPGGLFSVKVPDPNNPSATQTLTLASYWIATVDRWSLKGQTLTALGRPCTNYLDPSECFSDPMLSAQRYVISVAAPKPAIQVVSRNQLTDALARAYTKAGSITSIPDPLWGLVQVPEQFFLTGPPATLPTKYFQAGLPSLDPNIAGRAVEYEYNFKVGLDSVDWTITNTDSGASVTFADVPPPARDPVTHAIAPNAPWFTYTFSTAGHYQVTAVEHYSVQVWTYYFTCYPGCFVDYSGGYQPYPGGTFDLPAAVNGQPYLVLQVGQIEGVPVTPAR